MVFSTMASNSLPGPHDTLREVTPNGITILSRYNSNNPSVVVHGYLNNGSLGDPDDRLGLAGFTASMLMRGTAQRTFNQIYALLESSGASLSFNSNVHTTSFSGKALVEDFPLLVDVIREVVSSPVFPVSHVEKLRGQLLTGLALRAQDTADMASLTFDQILFADHPYARPEDGFPETITRITREDLAEYHARYYGPQGMVLVVVGAVEPELAVRVIREALGGWTNPGQPEPPALPALTLLQRETEKKVSIPGKAQADLVLGGNGPVRNSPDYMAVSLGNSILGQFGMYGRIGEVVREQSGLAYYAYTRLNSGIGPGSWEVSAGVNPANVHKTIALVREEVARFVSQPVTEEELSDSQANFIGRLPLSLESNSGVAGVLLNLERYHLGLDYYHTYSERVMAVTPAGIQEAATHYLDPKRLAIAVAGP